MIDDAKRAALVLYPTDWKTFPDGFQVDNNANLRAVAEQVFEHVFEVLQSEEVAEGVAEAFLRRFRIFGDDDKQTDIANMSTALLFARLKICEPLESQEKARADNE